MMISLVTPLLAVVLGALFLSETLPPQTYFGGALILASIGLIVIRPGRNASVNERDGREPNNHAS
jgi:drug/metabolite transporter (DMT)-like permease